MTTHLAAVIPAKGQPFEVQTRPTPKPGPDEILIAVKSVALNPADNHMRNHGLFIPKYPTVIGFDISGLVLEIGAKVPTGGYTNDGVSDDQPSFQPGVTRVATYAASFWKSCGPDYGAFQERCLVPWQHAIPIFDENISWNEAATLPVAVEVALNAWDVMGIPRAGKTAPSAAVSPASTSGGTQKQNRNKNEALLIWGASSSVGTMGVQSAQLLRENLNSPFGTVYATAGLSNKSYIVSLGADRVFDYKDPQVVDAIVSAAEKDGFVIRHCFLATGQLAPCQAVLMAFLGRDRERVKARTAKIASAPIVHSDAEVLDGLETIFLMPSAVEEERLEHFCHVSTWLRENLAKRTIRPSPELRVVGKGLEAINSGLDMLLRGVSCEKLVVEVGE
ncbi:chaperonin 10-like protein [Leptodontidium sp. 2 PMI_412]|nr:chaperonin 10-like protein [Leptodontidium sp. 2 PMI_412]